MPSNVSLASTIGPQKCSGKIGATPVENGQIARPASKLKVIFTVWSSIASTELMPCGSSRWQDSRHRPQGREVPAESVVLLDGVPREHDVVGVIGLAVGPRDVVAQIDGDRPGIAVGHHFGRRVVGGQGRDQRVGGTLIGVERPSVGIDVVRPHVVLGVERRPRVVRGRVTEDGDRVREPVRRSGGRPLMGRSCLWCRLLAAVVVVVAPSSGSSWPVSEHAATIIAMTARSASQRHRLVVVFTVWSSYFLPYSLTTDLPAPRAVAVEVPNKRVAIGEHRNRDPEGGKTSKPPCNTPPGGSDR
jgi:hypothetical protein